ncbi:MAG: single-stranded DNA-binding protein [Dehalococcoidales bacterium]|nr:single-stranded DNA-binding protein [Dehalococcoidales bacterium]
MYKITQGLDGTLTVYVTKDPEKRKMPDGSPVVEFMTTLKGDYILDENKQVVLDDNGYKQKAVIWFKVTVFGKLAEQCEKHIKKQSFVSLEKGNLRFHEYQGKSHFEWKPKIVKLIENNEPVDVMTLS